MTKPHIQVETKFGILTARLSHDPVFPGIWFSLQVPSGEDVTLGCVEVNDDEDPNAELRTIVYAKEKYDNPTHYITHYLMTEAERNEVYDS